MVRKHILTGSCGAFLVLVFLVAVAATASGAEFYLRAEAVTKTMPDARVVTMWGFALSDDIFATGTATVPGPLLEVAPGDSTLTIHLKNDLPEATSLVIPGQIATMTPVWNDESSGNRPSLAARVRSFTHEAGKLGGTAKYTWNNLKPGTYLYESGTHPSVQIQMGLYGALKKDEAVGQAYNSGATAYDKEGVVVVSEIDPELHDAVATNNYGPGLAMSSTIDYSPQYFLINGEADLAAMGVVQSGSITVGDRILVRLLNAGLKTRVPLLLGSYMTVLAQDGNLAPFLKERYSLTLTAGKTMDVLVTPTIAGFLGISDRRGYVTPGATATGGTVGVDPAPVVPAGGGVAPAPAAGGGGGGGGCFISTVLDR